MKIGDNLPSGDYGNENVVFHPILDRTLFRAGEIASIKLVSRLKNLLDLKFQVKMNILRLRN
ncbi:hypothetical protein LEP1GSC124_0257 [Leptospira interrogans serovar Pyrogenes str. 200701872]|uniref:Uncharacterized protein n=1 Tax=Leptospira interrogans serovar Pyrogenes str. 200701872 TaxID=1193029 RepID=M6ZJG7_LEPIR|nr:hypothetical protein LEP1GSC124_0257 [Leptospira interrogans serovar Pyrogenes str. 200701872]